MMITIVLVKLVSSSCRRFQNGTKSSDEVLCKIKENCYRNVSNVHKNNDTNVKIYGVREDKQGVENIWTEEG
jgi:hypothetical protein